MLEANTVLGRDSPFQIPHQVPIVLRHPGFRKGPSRRIPRILRKPILFSGGRDTVAGVRSPGRHEDRPADAGHSADIEASGSGPEQLDDGPVQPGEAPDQPANGSDQQEPTRLDISPSDQNGAVEPTPQAEVPADPAVSEQAEERVDLPRMAWLVTTLACMIAVVVLLVQGYFGYALVTFAVAVSAAINLT
jgi:hypothetical protein